ncbi:hypothetical protein LUPAC06_02284 [Micromonospora saelicesensis]|nr:hypothetical protein LUPAC06_02284 [Micromonospora saelicesensis]
MAANRQNRDVPAKRHHSGAGISAPADDVRRMDRVTVTRLVLRTLVAVDLGWVGSQVNSEAFLRDRGRPGWLGVVEGKFTSGQRGFVRPTIRPPAYGKSEEHGRPTFSDEFSRSYMPIVVESTTSERYEVGILKWYVEWIKVGPTGAISLCARAELLDPGRLAIVPEIVRSYHQFRLQLKRKCPELWQAFLEYWSETVPEYAVDENRVSELGDHLELYDVVDFDFLVDGDQSQPKDLYREGPTDALRAIAGLTRMSHVMHTYSEESVRTLSGYDLGNRPDELWIVNAERLTRHHPEHLTDAGKQLFMEDVVGAVEILLQQRATLKYVSSWVRRTRAVFLDRLTDDSQVEQKHLAMRRLLTEMAWTSDLYSESISVARDSGSSFFRSVVSRVATLKEIGENRNEVSDSVGGLLSISQAVFGERTAAASSQLQAVSVNFEKTSRNMAVAAVVVAMAAAALAVLQIWVALSPPAPLHPPSPAPHSSSTVGFSSPR